MAAQIPQDAVHFRTGEAIDLPKLWRAVRTVQDAHRFAVCPNHMHMGGTMIARVDHHP